MFRNSKKQGDWGLGEAIAHFTRLGMTVCIPLTDSQEYDLVIDDGLGKMLRIQVKTTTRKTKSGNFSVGLRTCGGIDGRMLKKPTERSFDLLFVAVSSGETYLIPAGEISGFSEITLWKRFEKFKCADMGIGNPK